VIETCVCKCNLIRGRINIKCRVRAVKESEKPAADHDLIEKLKYDVIDFVSSFAVPIIKSFRDWINFMSI
jgi:hypothetical protein